MDPANTIVKVTTTYGLQFDIVTGNFQTTQESQTVEILARETPAAETATKARRTAPK